MSAIDAVQDKLSKVSLDTMTVFAEMKALIMDIKANVDLTNVSSKTVAAGIEELKAQHEDEIANLKLEHKSELSNAVYQLSVERKAHLDEIRKYEEALDAERAKNRDIELHFAAVEQKLAALKK